jgi:hypothetical protein
MAICRPAQSNLTRTTGFNLPSTTISPHSTHINISNTHQPSSPTPLSKRQRIHTIVSFAVALTAAIFLITAIVALYYIDSPTARLGTLCGFTIVFAANLASFTNCRRYEIFVATAAYAAVLVVFVSGNLAASNVWNTWNELAASGATNAQLVNGAQTVTVYSATTTATETFSLFDPDVRTLTATVTQALETVLVTVVETAMPTSTSAAVKKTGLNRYSPAVKAGIGLGIACAAMLALVLAVGIVIFVGSYSVFLFVKLCGLVRDWVKGMRVTQ